MEKISDHIRPLIQPDGSLHFNAEQIQTLIRWLDKSEEMHRQKDYLISQLLSELKFLQGDK